MNNQILLVLGGLLLLGGCGSPGDPAEKSPPESAADSTVASESTNRSFVQIEDGVGRRVQLEAPAQRIVSLAAGFTESLFAIGCGGQVVLRDKWSDYPAQARALPVTDSVSPSVEAIAGYRPDLVLLYFSDDRFVAAFEAVGIPVAVFDPADFEGVARDVEKLGVLCGMPSEAAGVAAEMRAVRDKVVTKSRDLGRPTVYIEIDGSDPTRPWTASRGSFVHELLGFAGGTNIVSHLGTAYPQISAEEVIRSDPRFILLAHVDGDNREDALAQIVKRPGFSTLQAIRSRRIINRIDKDLLTTTGPRLAVGLSQLYEALHAGQEK